MQTTRRRGDRDDIVLFICITVGAVLAFALTGGAGVGTAVGAASGLGLVALHRRHVQGGSEPRR